MSDDSREFSIALVGGGPRATYALERLAATIDRLDGRRLAVHVYELSGEFGAGQVHSTEQPHTSYLNRDGSRIGFAADHTVAGADPIRPPEERPTLYEWCRQRFRATGDAAFDLAPGDLPRRRQHGVALREMFDRHVDELTKVPGVTVTLHAEEVTDLPATDDGRLDVVSTSGVHCTADRVLLVTGHSSNDCAGEPGPEAYRAFAQRTGAGYVPSAYPLQQHLSPESLPAGSTVGCAGLGLTAIDQILYLTEGRGGSFDRVDGRLSYRAGGLEPATVHAFSWTGFLPNTRPLNRKEQPHQGWFLTGEAIDRLRASAGLPAEDGGRPQLDFESQVMPLIVLEMAAVHYGTLFGSTAVDLIAAEVDDAYRQFLDGRAEPGQVTRLLPGVERVAALVGGKLREVLAGRLSLTEAAKAVPGWDPALSLTRWLTAVFGTDLAATVEGLDPEQRAKLPLPTTSPWRLATQPSGNRFDWAGLLHPVRLRPGSTQHEFKAAYLDFLDRDLLWANQGNADNPYKASVDGVWHDLRSVISHAVDGGGLTADSHRQFLDRHRRLQNKLSGGTAPEVMAKIRALIEHGVLDVSAGPRAVVLFDEESGRFVLHGDETAMRAPLDVLLDSRVHPFDATRDVRPLYRNLIDRGLVRLWQNRTPGQQTFVPGFIDLDGASRPIGRDGRAVEAITVLGPPAAARRTDDFSALQPNLDDVLAREIVAWLDGVWAAFGAAARS
ncbi:FAD/NAD(P)-binding protein [Kitasatospora sp. RB6PN24]|uniref:FAD/NAD(P)-binding protein n=1 Tax=Kitasatospora humi TaxID=2893891 RepID=UPI001E41126E|nr:FAD/NAD(P)-binding protein [Kitasatospora humi]MCC9311498.1 FAD/NAD(P)-binding protein [Kitasatospora humi]